jgi:hypothetical protein
MIYSGDNFRLRFGRDYSCKRWAWSLYLVILPLPTPECYLRRGRFVIDWNIGPFYFRGVPWWKYGFYFSLLPKFRRDARGTFLDLVRYGTV